jgi:hypothetical protein
MPDRAFTHPSFGQRVRVELHGCEVRLVFTSSDMAMAESLAEELVEQLANGMLSIVLTGNPISTEQTRQ